MSLLAFDYFFVPPLHQFSLVHIQNAPILLIFLLVGLLFSYLASNLRRKNLIANREITARKTSEAELVKYKDRLEELVQQRTAELGKVNQDLQNEIARCKMTEEDLRDSEQRWETTLASIGDAVIATDTKGTIIFMNSVAETLTGWTRDESYNKPIAEIFNIINENTRQTADNPVNKVLEQGVVCGLANHTLLIRKDKQEIAIDDSGAPIKTQDGATAGVVLVFRDISARRKADQNLLESEKRYRSLFENMIDGYAHCRIIFENDEPQDFVYLAVNKSFEKLTGLKDAAGRRVTEIIPGIKESNPELLQIYSRVASTGWPERFETYVDQLKTWFSVSVYSVEKGTFTAVFENITERKLTEQALTRQKDILQIIMDHAHTHLVYLDKDFNFVAVNTAYAQTSHKAPEELIGKNHFYFYPDEENEMIFKRVRDTGTAESYQDRPFLFPDQPEKGVTFWDWTLTPVKDSSGRVEGLVFSLVETTERKKIEASLKRYTAELESANAELEAFSYSVSHDLRAPLRTMDGFSQAVIEDYADKLDAQGKDYLNRVRESSQLMSRLIDDLLKLSRITRTEMFFSDVNLSDIVKSIADELAINEPANKKEVLITPGVIVKGDAGLLRIMMLNLLENAWKFTSKCPQARIEFGVTQEDGQKVYFIRDNGAGFNMQYADKLFQPFQRLHSSQEYPGSGIGLATVQRIVRRHGGKIWAESEVDRGANFCFTIGELNIEGVTAQPFR